MLFPTGLRNGQSNLILKKQKNIVFSRRDSQHPPVYFGINGDEIDEVDNHCHLGITFQSTATWKKHIDGIYKKKKSMLSFIFTQTS